MRAAFHRRPRRRIRSIARLAPPLAAVATIGLFAFGATGTLGQLTASIRNTDNVAPTATVNLIETQNGNTCAAPGGGQWTDCTTINKFGAGSLTSGGTTTASVTLTNDSTVPAQLFLLPSACTDTLTGAGGALCDAVTVQVVCNGTTIVATPTLNAFHAGRNFPTGYPGPTLAAGATTTCVFTLTAGTIPAAGGVSQPIAWRLVP